VSKRGRLWGWALMLTLATAPAVAAAGPVEEARAVVEQGRKILAKAKKRSRKRPLLLAEGLRKYANAYLLITRRKLENDAPDLLQEISDTIKATNELPEVELMRQEFLKKAIDAVEAGELTQAYDHLASLRDLDPRSWEVEFALTVIGQRMEGG
jgi:hypothetical protein